jgi:hypothetical protein
MIGTPINVEHDNGRCSRVNAGKIVELRRLS